MNSGTTYSLIAANVPLSAVELARNPGYPVNDISPSTAQSLYYGDRGQYPFKGFGLLDLAATYGIPVWKSARPWIKVELFNLLNDQKLIKWNTTVTPDPNSPKDANGLPTGYIQGSNFGKATQDNNFPQPLPGTNGGRLFRMVGHRVVDGQLPTRSGTSCFARSEKAAGPGRPRPGARHGSQAYNTS